MGRDSQEKTPFFAPNLAALGLNDQSGKGGTGLEKTAFCLQDEDRYIQKWQHKVGKNQSQAVLPFQQQNSL